MRSILYGLCLLCLAGCSTMADMGARINEEVDAYLASREKADYVQVVYPAELRRYQERDTPAAAGPQVVQQ